MIDVRMKPCADGKQRPETVAFTSYAPDANTAPVGVKAFIAAATLRQADHNCAFSNEGASGSVTITLPTPFAGARFMFFKTAQQTLVVSAPAGVTINGNTTYTNSTNTSGEANQAFITVTGISATAYRITGSLGTWTGA